MFGVNFLHFLKQDGYSLAASDAGGPDAVLLVLLAQFVNNVSRNPEPGKKKILKYIHHQGPHPFNLIWI